MEGIDKEKNVNPNNESDEKKMTQEEITDSFISNYKKYKALLNKFWSINSEFERGDDDHFENEYKKIRDEINSFSKDDGILSKLFEEIKEEAISVVDYQSRHEGETDIIKITDKGTFFKSYNPFSQNEFEGNIYDYSNNKLEIQSKLELVLKTNNGLINDINKENEVIKQAQDRIEKVI